MAKQYTTHQLRDLATIYTIQSRPKRRRAMLSLSQRSGHTYEALRVAASIRNISKLPALVFYPEVVIDLRALYLKYPRSQRIGLHIGKPFRDALASFCYRHHLSRGSVLKTAHRLGLTK